MSDYPAPRPEEYPSEAPLPQPGGSAPGPPDNGSAADTAKEQARAVTGDVKGQTQQVAAHAAEETKAVVEQAKTQLQDLLGQTRSELTQQATGQQQRLAAGLRSFGQELDEMTNGSQRPGLAGEAASQLSGRAHQAADFLQNRDFGGVLDELTGFARRRPGAFLLGAALLGVVAGRVTRGLTADTDESSAAGSGGSSPRLPYESVPTDLTAPVAAPYASSDPYATPAGGTAYQLEPDAAGRNSAFPEEVTDPTRSDAFPSLLPDDGDRSRL